MGDAVAPSAPITFSLLSSPPHRHYHSFQRSCRVANLTCVGPSEPGVVHYTTGAAGAWLDATELYPSNYIDATILGQYGYSMAHAPNATALRLTFFLNVNNTIGDDVWITRPAA